jgi:hypothetical protein
MSKTFRDGPDSIRNGVPRTKGIRNAFVASAGVRNAAPMRDKRDRRAKDAKRSWKNEVW